MATELFKREFKSADGKEVLVTVRQLAASKALDLHIELIGKLGHSIFPFIENKHSFGDIIYLMQQGYKSDLTQLIKRVVCMAAVDGQEVNERQFDFVYSDLMLVHNIFAFVLEANFLDFFKEGLEINERRRLEAEEASKLEEQKNSSPEKI